LIFQLSCLQTAEKEPRSGIKQIPISNKIAERTYLAPTIISLDTMPTAFFTASSVRLDLRKSKQTDNSGQKTTFRNELAYEHFTTFSTEQGLALSTVLCSFADKQGILWFGTQGGGVSKYDGKTFTNYSTSEGLSHNTVLCIVEDKSGNLWFGTDGGGVSRFDGISFTTFSTENGLASAIIRDIEEAKDGKLWFATFGKGITILDPSKNSNDSGRFRYLNTTNGLIGDDIWAMSWDSKERLWIATDENGIGMYDGKTCIRLPNNEKTEIHTRAIFISKKNTLWIGTDQGEIAALDLSNIRTDFHALNYFKNPDGMSDNSVKCFTEDKEGNIWIGVSEAGLIKAIEHLDQWSFTNYSTLNGLPNNSVTCLSKDLSENLWIGTDGGGISKYSGSAFSHYTTTQGLSNNSLWGIDRTMDGTYWFGTDGNGLCFYNPDHTQQGFGCIDQKGGLRASVILSLKKNHNEHIWLGTLENGVIEFDGKRFNYYNTKQGLVHNMIVSIFEDQQGNMWFGSGGGGVSKFTPSQNGQASTFINYTNEQGLADDVVLCITETKKGEMWFGTQKGGISKLRTDDVKAGESSFINYSTEQGLSNNTVYSLLNDHKGDLFIGTENGLSILRSSSNKGSPIFTNYTTLQGLPDNFITNILQLPEGKIIVGTNDGIAFFNEDLSLNSNGLLSGLEVFNNSTGYPIKDVNGQGSMFLDSKGIIWAGTGYDKVGLIRLDPAAVTRNTKVPHLVIENIRLNEEKISWYSLAKKQKDHWVEDSILQARQEIMCYGYSLNKEKQEDLQKRYKDISFDSISPFYPIPQHLVLPYEHNQITIEFNCIEVSRHAMVNYQYMLSGYDKTWSPVLKKTEATFGNMNEGTYTFMVKAQSPDGVWSDPISYTFDVLPPWYRTIWAYLLYIVLISLSLRLYLRWRTNELKKRQQQLIQTVKERTAEVVSEKKEAEKQREKAEKEYQRSEELLLNILPAEIAEELKVKGEVSAKQFQAVTVLFSDFVNFTGISQTLSPQKLVSEVHHYFTAFDAIMEKYGLEKIKTIGDAYLAVSGLPHNQPDHAKKAIQAAQEIIEFIAERRKNGGLFDIRIGLSSGQVVAGIVGVKKFAYDIWGDTVNTAARMEQNSELGKINISGETYELIKHEFHCVYRGKIAAKNKGEIDMYFVE